MRRGAAVIETPSPKPMKNLVGGRKGSVSASFEEVAFVDGD